MPGGIRKSEGSKGEAMRPMEGRVRISRNPGGAAPRKAG
jgi:hypothetical protein